MGSPFLSGTAGFLILCLVAQGQLAAALPTASQALELKPLQSGVDYEIPTAEQVAKCSIQSAAKDGLSGWIVLNASAQTLRRFIDSNADNKIDMWCYYKDGIEIYRDLDTDFDGKSDEYRWLSTAGTRWGLDADEDGRIDSWKMISPEEVTAEVVFALRDKDSARFERLLPSKAEIESLGLGEKPRQELLQRVEASRAGFAAMATSQKIVGSETQWLQFGATRPGVVPAGTEGSTKDIVIYDNAAAIISTGGQNGQLVVGTLIQVGSSWRTVDLPKSEVGDGFFFAAMMRPRQTETEVPGGIDENMQKLLSDLEAVDKVLLTANPTDRPKLHGQRADLLEQIVAKTPAGTDRQMWLRQLVDTVGTAVQTNEFPNGTVRLKAIYDQIQAGADTALLPHIRFTYMTALYNQQIQQPDADAAKLQEKLIQDLEAFVNDYPKAEESAEAMLQLAIAEEFAGKDEKAAQWYGRIVADFASASVAVKAAGAKRRLESVGKSITLRGKTLTGSAVDLDQYRGRVVLVHYWSTWCEPCKRDLQTLKALQAKFFKSGFSLIGVSLDSDARLLDQFIRAQQLAWPQLHEPGGLDSRLANELGILTLPTMILIDKSGRVVRRNVHAGEVETELEKLLKP
jgi:thiol-disulfide isomerase/thioredoxin